MAELSPVYCFLVGTGFLKKDLFILFTFVWSTSFTSGPSLTTTAFKLPIRSCTTRPYSCTKHQRPSWIRWELTFWRAVNASNGTLLNLPRRCRLPMRGQGLRKKKCWRISFGKSHLGPGGCLLLILVNFETLTFLRHRSSTNRLSPISHIISRPGWKFFACY